MEYKKIIQNLRYREQNRKIPKYKLAYKDFYHEICILSYLSKDIFCQSILLPNLDIG